MCIQIIKSLWIPNLSPNKIEIPDNNGYLCPSITSCLPNIRIIAFLDCDCFVSPCIEPCWTPATRNMEFISLTHEILLLCKNYVENVQFEFSKAAQFYRSTPKFDERTSLPNDDACFDRNRIWIPIRAYSTIMIAIGIAKNTSDESSHNGNPSGFWSIAQNADSSIVVLSVGRWIERGLIRSILVKYMLYISALCNIQVEIVRVSEYMDENNRTI